MTVDEAIKQPPLHKGDLKHLILAASVGDQEAARRLVSPFVAPGEKLVNFGVSAKFGLFPTYDFFFVTDRQVGDLEITPLTGNLNVEVAYLKSISAFVLKQPAISIIYRLLMWSAYVWLPIGLYMVGAALLVPILGGLIGFFLSLILGVSGLPLAFLVVIPALVRSYLHFRKSGLYLILTATTTGVLIFADRDKFDMITKISRQVSELKRRLDSVSN